mmetsp:Transcript_34638/g.93840  ORF Transcript_34638/g.93840 Transcript_34638/m.93840 type:complete len:92 (+) Transcript_34638:10-285(+)
MHCGRSRPEKTQHNKRRRNAHAQICCCGQGGALVLFLVLWPGRSEVALPKLLLRARGRWPAERLISSAVLALLLDALSRGATLSTEKSGSP